MRRVVFIVLYPIMFAMLYHIFLYPPAVPFPHTTLYPFLVILPSLYPIFVCTASLCFIGATSALHHSRRIRIFTCRRRREVLRVEPARYLLPVCVPFAVFSCFFKPGKVRSKPVPRRTSLPSVYLGTSNPSTVSYVVCMLSIYHLRNVLFMVQIQPARYQWD